MPKKSKVNKLSRMSEEERARYLQHRADLEEEARRRKRELIARFIKNKLDKEESYSKMNTAKINQEWRYILRKIKCKQMASDIQGMIISFNFLVERKDRQILSLTRALEDSDEQHRRAFQTHTENLNYFLRIGAQRLDKLHTEYDRQKDLLLENWEGEELDITDNQDRAEMKLTLITYIQDRDFRAYKKKREIAMLTAKNDERLEHEEQMRNLCRPKQLEIELYFNKLRDTYDSYEEHHNPMMGHYRALREKDDFYQRDIARNERLIEQATDILMNLQKEWMRTTKSLSNKMNRMTNRKEDLAKKYWQMKKESKLMSCRDNDMLTVLVNCSQDTIKRLEEVNSKVNKITQMNQICSKYENSRLDVLEDCPEDWIPLNFEHLNEEMINECKEYMKMDKFLNKVNRVKVQTMCLKAEKAKLAKENIQLKQYIKKYLTELALKGGKDRPASMKYTSNIQKTDENGRTLYRPVTCIEGALSNAVMYEKRMKLQEQRDKELGGIRAYPRVCW
ncbi:Coiled-coil domain-containing protein 65 [Papilio xuthus]|uniref:Dynein regulatory complex subunit 2 n=1 Tax=Papilio xuthus TaxID=66420 RepID=A0A194PX12_PAPXU|nr:Coiled-coil domain-containing protein 65 [Papilio xuthus]